ncbi:FAD-binding protein [Streptomyces aureus]
MARKRLPEGGRHRGGAGPDHQGTPTPVHHKEVQRLRRHRKGRGLRTRRQRLRPLLRRPDPPEPQPRPLDKGPFYAVPVHPGDIGTKGGLVTDADARVLREDGTPVAGLYASGNCSAAVMGETYPGPGATIGPAMAFSWAAVNDIAGPSTPDGP